jgi:hypothetical protein
MSDLVMEYVSQFIARDFLEAYEKASGSSPKEFVPPEFDDIIYKKITKAIRKNMGQNIKTLRFIMFLAAALICTLSITFTALVLLQDTLRSEIFDIILSFIK